MHGSLVPWLGTAAIAMLVIVVAGVLPATGAFFQLDVPSAIAVWTVAFGFGIGASWLDRRLEFGPVVYGTLVLATCAAVLFFAASMIALCRPPGSSAMAGLFILASAYYGHLYRMTVGFPFGWLAILAALLGAAALNTDPANWMVFSVAAPAAFGGSWLLGTMARRAEKARRAGEAYKAAVQAHILDEKSRDVTQLSRTMVEMLQTMHDASTVLSTALFNVEELRKAGEARHRGERAEDAETDAVEDLSTQLVRLRQLLKDTRELGHSRSDQLEALQSVAPLPVVSEVLRQLRVRFPQVDLRSSGAESSLGVIVSGGAESLRRILENLILNACQGDGSVGASRVLVSVQEAVTVGSVAIEVRDDGPGFVEEQLEAPITAFESSKEDGTGLGLYTAERLVRASGGSVARENAADGGAVVTVFLRAVAPS
jgi:signal transduction histidine kinase